MNDVTIEITITALDRIRNALADARENATELLCEHDLKLGRTTNKNRHIADMYEAQIAECNEIILDLCDS